MPDEDVPDAARDAHPATASARRRSPSPENSDADRPRVGDVVYTFDENRRVYDATKPGIGLAPIFSEHFHPHLVVGEERASWLVASARTPGLSRKLAKSKVISAKEFEARCWIHSNRRDLVEALKACGDIEVLKAVSDLLTPWKPCA